MYIEHAALWVRDLEAMKDFYVKYFGASANDLYHNETKQFKSYFLSFGSGARLELMTRPDIKENDDPAFGYAHLPFATGSEEAVDQLTEKLVVDGYVLNNGPRTTGDGYYEFVIEDPEGNLIEITV